MFGLLFDVPITILRMSLNMADLPKARSATPVIIMNVFAAPLSSTIVILDERKESNTKLCR